MRKGLFVLLVIGLLGVLAACGDDEVSLEEEVAFEEFQDDTLDLSLDTDQALAEYFELVEEEESAEGKRVLEEKALPLLEELLEEYEQIDFSHEVLAEFIDSVKDSYMYRKQIQELILDHFNQIEAGESASDDADVIYDVVNYESKSFDATVHAFEIAEENRDVEVLQAGDENVIEPLTEEDKAYFEDWYTQIFASYEKGLEE